MTQKKITPEEAREMITQNNAAKNFVILDVRTPEEFAEEHLEKALNINIKDHSFLEKIKVLDITKTYLIHCHSGSRAARAATLMDELGFKKVFTVEGCMFEE